MHRLSLVQEARSERRFLYVWKTRTGVASMEPSTTKNSLRTKLVIRLATVLARVFHYEICAYASHIAYYRKMARHTEAEVDET